MAEERPEELSPLLQAAYRHDWDTVQRLRRGGAIADVSDAAAAGDVEAVRRFLDADPSVLEARTPDGFTPLHLAAYLGQPAAVEVLLAAGADPNAVADNPSRLRPLHGATAARMLASVRLLLDAGAEPDAQQEGGYTALMAATMHGDEDIVVLLLDRGADPDVRTEDGRTAAEFATDA